MFYSDVVTQSTSEGDYAMLVRLLILTLFIPTCLLAAPKRMEVVVYSQENIRKHSCIETKWLRCISVEERFLPHQAYFSSLEDVVGKYAKCDIYMGEPVLRRIVAKKADIPYLSLKLKDPKKRAVTLRLFEQEPPPNESKIDLLLDGKIVGENLRTLTMQKLRVGFFISLEASPALSLKLLLAQKKGRLKWRSATVKGTDE